MAALTPVPVAVWAALPAHNDDLFRPTVYVVRVAALAAAFPAAVLHAAVAECQASLQRSRGIEFDDVRARHKTGKAIKALEAALARQAEDSDEPSGYRPEGAALYDGTPGSGSIARSKGRSAMSGADPFKTLFDKRRQADEDVDTAADALQVATLAQRRCRGAIWAAIEASADAQGATADLRDHVSRLEVLVLELTAKLRGEGGA